MNQVTLQFDDGFSWNHHQGVSFKGYFYDEHQQFVKGTDALEHFTDVPDAQALSRKLQLLDGCFAVVIRREQEILLGVDSLSFFTLFYRHEPSGWSISDNWYALRGKKETEELNRRVFPEFLAAGFVLGGDTLDRRITKTMPGTVVRLAQDGTTEVLQWFDFLPRGFSEDGLQQLQQQLAGVLERITHRLIDSLGGRTAVVPLSGGYDSRLIACMLKKAGYEKVVCITYGRPNPESETSKAVAAALGYPWHMTDYRKVDASGYLADPVFQKYYRYAGNGFSMPYLQEYFAIKELKEKGIIAQDAVFIPGHSGDWLAGSYLERTIRTDVGREKLPQWIRKKYFIFSPSGKTAAATLQQRIAAELPGALPEGTLTHPHYNVLVENWDAREKLPKFIFHSSQVFPFFGYEVRFPLWDKELRDFFRSVPYEYREHRMLYNDTLEQQYFLPLGVHYPVQKDHTTPLLPATWSKSIRGCIRKLLPMPVVLRRLRKHDYICYDTFTIPMNRALKKASYEPLKRTYSFNARICQWYLFTLKRK